MPCDKRLLPKTSKNNLQIGNTMKQQQTKKTHKPTNYFSASFKKKKKNMQRNKYKNKAKCS